MNSQPPAKGSLEDLFRHHLLESEAAAVAPRPLVWEQLDNSLLLAQNEKYRRRLLVHRWAVAASLLLAMLAAGGWWHSQQTAMPRLATAAPHETPTAAGAAVAGQSPAAGVAQVGRLSRVGQPQDDALAAGTQSRPPTYAWSATAATLAAGRGGATTGATARPGGAGLAARGLKAASTGGYAGAASYAASTSDATSPLTAQPIGSTLTSTSAGSFTSTTGSTVAQAINLANRFGEGELAARGVKLSPLAASLPPTLAQTDVPTLPTTALRRWQFEVAYAATAFQPNVDFSRDAADYNKTLGYNTVSLSRAAAAEYRANLRAGLGQRLSLRASRWLGGHWSLSTGLEAAQQEASSATSAAFVGEQVAYSTAASNAAPAPRTLRSSSYRYRSAGIPVELRYSNPVKTGLSFYGRLGAVVSALLNVRSEVAGSPEATRTYLLLSAGSPYRRVSATVRAGAGVQYRPARRGWALNVGPVAEGGVQSLNTDPTQTFWSQQRPYSFGVEAGVELGGGLKVQ